MSKELKAQKFYNEGFNSKKEDKNPYPKDDYGYELWKEGRWDAVVSDANKYACNFIKL